MRVAGPVAHSPGGCVPCACMAVPYHRRTTETRRLRHPHPGGEGTTLEFKEDLSSSFARELVVLANTIGGKILLGVRDNDSIVGVLDTKTLRARNCETRLYPSSILSNLAIVLPVPGASAMTRAAVIPWSADDTAAALRARYRAEPEGVVRTRLHALWLLRQPEAGWGATGARSSSGCGGTGRGA